MKRPVSLKLSHPMYMDPTALSVPATTVIPLDDSNQMLLPSQTKNEKENTDGLPGYYQISEKTAINPKADEFTLDYLENAKPPKRKLPFLKRHCITRWLCCTCCLPPCLAYICWFVFIAIVICIIVIGAILGTFSIPKVSFINAETTQAEGENTLQAIQRTSNGFTIPLKLNLNVQNPNPVDIDLSNIKATGFHPTSNGNQVQVGTGHLDSLFVPKNSNTTFTYPFNIEYDPADPNANTLLLTLIQKCGFTGEQPSNLNIKYSVKFAAKVLFVTVNPTIANGVSIACPIQKDQIAEFLPDEFKGLAGVLANIGTGLSSVFGNDALGGLKDIFSQLTS